MRLSGSYRHPRLVFSRLPSRWCSARLLRRRSVWLPVTCINDPSGKCHVSSLIKVSVGYCCIPEGEQDVSPAVHRQGL